MSQESTVIEPRGPGCLLRILYFIFVGLWLGGAWTIIAAVLIVTIIGMPLGLWMLNSLPQVMTLHPRRQVAHVTMQDGRPVMTHSNLPQLPFLLRALYFILIGWWFSLIWNISAWLISGITLGLGLPLAFWMFDQVPAITTLARI